MGPGPRARGATGNASARGDSLHPPHFNGSGNPLQWVRSVMKWEKAHDNPCATSHRLGVPKIVRGHMLSKSLSGPAYRTVESSLDLDEINSEEGVSKIVKLLVQFNPATHAHEVFVKFKSLMMIRRYSKETFKVYVNRFDAAAAELRALTGQATYGEAEQFITFQLLEGAQLPTTIFMQVLGSCTTTGTQDDMLEKRIQNAITELTQLALQAQGNSGGDFLKRLPKAEDSTSALLRQAKDACKAELKAVGDEISKILAKFDFKSNPNHHVYSGIQGYGAVMISYESAKKALIALDAASHDIAPSNPIRSQFPPTYRPSLLSGPRVKPTAGSRGETAKANKSKKYSEWISQRKAKTKCMACRQIGHWAGDKECPANNISGGLYQGDNLPPESKDGKPPQIEKKVRFQQQPSFFH